MEIHIILIGYLISPLHSVCSEDCLSVNIINNFEKKYKYSVTKSLVMCMTKVTIFLSGWVHSTFWFAL